MKNIPAWEKLKKHPDIQRALLPDQLLEAAEEVSLQVRIEQIRNKLLSIIKACKNERKSEPLDSLKHSSDYQYILTEEEERWDFMKAALDELERLSKAITESTPTPVEKKLFSEQLEALYLKIKVAFSNFIRRSTQGEIFEHDSLRSIRDQVNAILKELNVVLEKSDNN